MCKDDSIDTVHADFADSNESIHMEWTLSFYVWAII